MKAKVDVKEVSIIERAQVALNSSDTEKQLVELSAKFKDITIVKDKDQRADCHSALMEVKKARTSIEATGKIARDDANKFSKAVIAEEKRLIAIVSTEEDRLAALRDAYDNEQAILKAKAEEEERLRIQAMKDKIAEIRNVPVSWARHTLDQLVAETEVFDAAVIDADYYGDFTLDAKIAHKETSDILHTMIAQKREDAAIAARQEAERVELERIKAEQEAERLQLAQQARELAERQAEIDKREAEEKARLAKEATERLVEDANKAAERFVEKPIVSAINKAFDSQGENGIDKVAAEITKTLLELPSSVELYVYLHTCTMNRYQVDKAQAKQMIVDMAKAMKT